MDKFVHHENYLAAMSFCFRRNIKIYPVPKNQKEYYIEVNNNGKLIRSPKTYKLKDWSNKIMELYVHYYNKLSPSDN